MIKEDIEKDLKTALKKKDMMLLQVLRFLLSSLHNQEIEKRAKIRRHPPATRGASAKAEEGGGGVGVPAEGGAPEGLREEKIAKEEQLTDEEIISVISSEIKKGKEVILEFEKGKREDLVKKEKVELEILQKYLPEQLSKEEIKKLAKEAIEKISAKEMKDMGKVMAEIMPKVKGKADGGAVSKIVKGLLCQPRTF